MVEPHYITFQTVKLLLGVKIELETSTLKVLSKKNLCNKDQKWKNPECFQCLFPIGKTNSVLVSQVNKHDLNNKFIIYKLTFAIPKKASPGNKGPKDK